MKYLYSLSGNDLVLEFPIHPNVAVNKGDPISFDYSTNPGTVYSAVGSDFFGVAAEDHSGVEDDFNPRSNGTKLKVICPPDGVYEMECPVFTVNYASECTSTSIHLQGCECEDVGGLYVMLVKKGESSTNTDKIGVLRKVVAIQHDYEHSNAYIVTVNTGGVGCQGDQYALVPSVGFYEVTFSNADVLTTSESNRHFIVMGIDASDVDGNGKAPIAHLKLRNGALSRISEYTPY